MYALHTVLINVLRYRIMNASNVGHLTHVDTKWTSGLPRGAQRPLVVGATAVARAVGAPMARGGVHAGGAVGREEVPNAPLDEVSERHVGEREERQDQQELQDHPREQRLQDDVRAEGQLKREVKASSQLYSRINTD